MEPIADEATLVVVVGETASGKTELALKLAQYFGGEIIAADARTVYKGMDIGTAKPSAGEQALVPHHLLDIATPDKPISAATFQQLARKAIGDIASRGKLPIMVGGSGLYIDSVLFNYDFRSPPTARLRQELSRLSVEELQSRLLARNIPLPKNECNPRHLQRALETDGAHLENRTLRSNTLILGISLDRAVLKERIEARVERMLGQGLEREVQELTIEYGWDAEPLKSIGYREFKPYFEGQAGLAETKERIIKNTLDYAKRQRTWFRRNKSIHWLTNPLDLDKPIDLITTLLNK